MDADIERAVKITKLINEHIAAVGCGDPECETCKMGIALGMEEDNFRLDHIDEAYNQGHRDGFARGKEQQAHDVKRAIKEMIDFSGLTPTEINEVEQILKKYTEA